MREVYLIMAGGNNRVTKNRVIGHRVIGSSEKALGLLADESFCQLQEWFVGRTPTADS
jgi:hypothetical protein